MYSRKIGQDVLSFGHQGALYRKSFVMYDRQSESLWVHVSGQAIKGPRKGQQLDFIPSEIMPWGDWVKRHPMTSALVGEKATGFMGTYQFKDSVGKFGLSVGQGREVVLIRYGMLPMVPVMHLEVGGESVVVAYDLQVKRAGAYSRKLDGEVLTFEVVNMTTDDGSGENGKMGQPLDLMRDSQSGSLWLRLTGECVIGEKKGKQLTPVPATPWLIDRWRGFFPDGKVLWLTD